MASRTIYAVGLVAIFAIGGRAFPIPTVETKDMSYDYRAENYLGRYTGPWMDDTLSCFDRVPAVLEYNLYTGELRAVSFMEDKPSNTDFQVYLTKYARDPRTMKTQSIANPYRIYYLNANNCTEIEDDQNHTYPLNKEAIWQITIPEDHVAYVVLPVFDLEQQLNGNCINDYVSMYSDSDNPEKLCSSLELVRRDYTREGLERLTIKFQSNEAINAGGFSGAVWLTHRNNLPRSRRDAAYTEIMETASVAEDEQAPSENEVEQAIACLADIVKHGETAAAKYREEAPNEECRKMAEAYFMYGSIKP